MALTMHHRSCLGELANAYSLAEIEILEGATVAQEAYLCSGTHNFNKPSLQLICRKITIKANAFVGVRAMILPGITVGENAVVGAHALVSKDVKKNVIVAGNPAQEIGERKIMNL